MADCVDVLFMFLYDVEVFVVVGWWNTHLNNKINMILSTLTISNIQSGLWRDIYRNIYINVINTMLYSWNYIISHVNYKYFWGLVLFFSFRIFSILIVWNIFICYLFPGDKVLESVGSLNFVVELIRFHNCLFLISKLFTSTLDLHIGSLQIRNL